MSVSLVRGNFTANTDVLLLCYIQNAETAGGKLKAINYLSVNRRQGTATELNPPNSALNAICAATLDSRQFSVEARHPPTLRS